MPMAPEPVISDAGSGTTARRCGLVSVPPSPGYAPPTSAGDYDIPIDRTPTPELIEDERELAAVR